MFKHRSIFIRRIIAIRKKARLLSAALGLVVTALLAVCAVYLVLNIHDYYA